MRENVDPFAGSGSFHVNPRSFYQARPEQAVPTPEELGLRFRELRKRQGVSLKEVSRRVGKSTERISRFERTGKASADLLLALVRTMSSATGFIDAFTVPKFSHISEVVKHAKRHRR